VGSSNGLAYIDDG
jgi:ATP-dependent Lon protease